MKGGEEGKERGMGMSGRGSVQANVCEAGRRGVRRRGAKWGRRGRGQISVYETRRRAVARRRSGRERGRGISQHMRICTYASMRGGEGKYANRRRGRARRNLWKQEEGGLY